MSRSPSIKLTEARKPVSKPLRKSGKLTTEELITGAKAKNNLAKSHVPSVFRLNSNMSLSASCSSTTSMDSIYSRASTGRICRPSPSSSRKKHSDTSVPRNYLPVPSPDVSQDKRRCAWITTTTDPLYICFHDEEWGVPEHDDKKLFELLVLSGALAELSWPAILSKRHIFREVFADFNPIAVEKLNEKKIVLPGNPACSLLSELKLRTIIENARQVSKVIDEFGSFDKYIWSFVNDKPIVNSFRYPRQVPVKTAKADLISKDLMRRGFRGVGPTVVYSFMQVAGITNDHLMSCYRFHDCKNEVDKVKEDEVKPEIEIFRGINELILSSDECLES